MIEDFERVIELGTKNKDVTILGKFIGELQIKYGVSSKTVYNRFRSCYGMSCTEYLSSRILPTKQELIDLVVNSVSHTEVLKKSGLSQRSFNGLYDKLLGCSTFKQARLTLLARQLRTEFVPIREDNRSLIYSQLLGDGSYNKARHGLRIIHGEKQIGYLKWKVNMLNKAYPKMNTEVVVRLHKQGHVYGDYYTPLGNVDIPSELDCVELLTNRGWLLWFLDDGCHTQNIRIACKRSESIRIKAVEVLSTFGIKSRYDEDSIIMCGRENDLKFYNNFIKPFIKEIPSCMKYKVDDIVELAGIGLSD